MALERGGGGGDQRNVVGRICGEGDIPYSGKHGRLDIIESKYVQSCRRRRDTTQPRSLRMTGCLALAQGTLCTVPTYASTVASQHHVRAVYITTCRFITSQVCATRHPEVDHEYAGTSTVRCPRYRVTWLARSTLQACCWCVPNDNAKSKSK